MKKRSDWERRESETWGKKQIMRLMENPYIREDIEAVASSRLIDWERLRGKKVAVTGATGLIGKLLVLALLRADEKYALNLSVQAFVRSREKAERIFAGVETDLACDDADGECMGCTCAQQVSSGAEADRLIFIVQDITDTPAEGLRSDFLIHTAAVTTSKLMVEKPVETILTAIDGTKAMLDYAVRCGMEGMVYLSSMEAYGTVPDGAGEIREKDLGFIDPVDARSSYSEGKRMCECLCAASATEYGVPVKIARLSATSGPGIDPEDRRVIGQFARSVIRRENIVLHTKGDKANCYLYTADALTGILFLLLNGAPGEEYNICNPETFCSIRELGETFASLDETGSVKVVIDIPENAKSLGYAPSSVMKMNADKFFSLGWRPQTGLKEMVRRITESIRLQMQ